MAAAQTAMTPTVEKPGFGDGIRCLFGGIGFIIRKPTIWPVAAIPMFLVVVVTVLLGALSITFVPALVAKLIGPTQGTLAVIGVGAAKLLASVVAIVVCALLGFALAQPLSGPALEHIVRVHEKELGAPERPPTGMLLDMVRSLKSALVGYMFGLPAILLLLLLSVVLPFAAVVTVPLKLLVAAYIIAWDLCDYPLSIRGLPIRIRVGTILRHRTAVLGFSLGLALAGLVPCLLFFFLPGGVAGAAKLMWKVEQYERAQGSDMDGIRRGA
jgi:CysZ protein